MPLKPLAPILLLALLLSACAIEPSYNRYQAAPGATQPGASDAVAELQRSARDALEQREYQQAIDYLQRAIRIEPRNPFSWHYLAETYWRAGDPRRCLDMLERSFSYSSSADRLEHLNQRLRARCEDG